jgi:hypothetical protein
MQIQIQIESQIFAGEKKVAVGAEEKESKHKEK